VITAILKICYLGVGNLAAHEISILKLNLASRKVLLQKTLQKPVGLENQPNLGIGLHNM
jgi:hypothetical protein